MTELPDTRESLLLNIRDPADNSAWGDFASIYRPAMYRLARRRGLSDADAEDLAQQVLSSVSQAIPTWTRDESKGTFRSWLVRIALNAIVNLKTRRPLATARGGTSVFRLLECIEQPDSVSELIEDEHRRAVYRWAARKCQAAFERETWLAFYLTMIGGASTDQVAVQLRKSVGSVYAARSRVMRRLKQFVQEYDCESNLSGDEDAHPQ